MSYEDYPSVMIPRREVIVHRRYFSPGRQLHLCLKSLRFIEQIPGNSEQARMRAFVQCFVRGLLADQTQPAPGSDLRGTEDLAVGVGSQCIGGDRRRQKLLLVGTLIS